MKSNHKIKGKEDTTPLMTSKLILLLMLCSFATTVSAQHIEAKNSVVDCGQVEYMQPVTAEFALENKSHKATKIKEVTTSCGCTKVEYPHGAIARNSEFYVWVTYDAAQMGHFEKFVDVYEENSDTPIELRIKGVVVREVIDFGGDYPYAIGNILIDKKTLEFDDVNKGDCPLQKIHMLNTGSETIQPVAMHLPDYIKADVSPTNIAPGKGGTLTIMFDSRYMTGLGLIKTKIYLGEHPGDKVSSNKEINVSAVLLPEIDLLSDEENSRAPKVELSADVLNLGAFNGKRKLKGEVIIRNKGLSELSIDDIDFSVAGLQLSLSTTSIGPGEEARLKVTAEQKLLRETDVRPYILMITNDPERPKIVLNINIDDLK